VCLAPSASSVDRREVGGGWYVRKRWGGGCASAFLHEGRDCQRQLLFLFFFAGTGSACRNFDLSMPPTSTSIDTSSNSLAASLEGTDLSNLFRVIDRDKSAHRHLFLSCIQTHTPERRVHGLNLTVPEDAKEVIKPWDERDDTVRYLESNVDDQVRRAVSFRNKKLLILIFFKKKKKQLMLHIPFVETVRIKSIVLKLGMRSPPSPALLNHSKKAEAN